MQLSELIRGERIGRKWSLKELGARLKNPRDGGPISPQYLNDIEKGRRTPSDDLLQQISELLDLEYTLLMTLAKRGLPEIEGYLATKPHESPQVGRVFRRAKRTGFTDWAAVEQLIEGNQLARRKKK